MALDRRSIALEMRNLRGPAREATVHEWAEHVGAYERRIADALEYMRLCAPGLTRGEAADVEAILGGFDGSEGLVDALREAVGTDA